MRRLIVLAVLKSGIAGGIVGAGKDSSWPPTRPGAVLHVESEVSGLRLYKSRPKRGMVTVRSAISKQDGQIVQVLVSTLVVPRCAPLEP